MAKKDDDLTLWGILLIVAAGFLAFGGGFEVGKIIANDARGWRNNNPGNLRHGVNWDGLSEQQTDPDFAQFKTIEYGFRALYKNLLSYRKAGIRTIRQIVNRWAPSSDNNNVANYINFLVKYTGVDADTPYPSTDDLNLVKGIATFENGGMMYSDDIISNGMAMAVS